MSANNLVVLLKINKLKIIITIIVTYWQRTPTENGCTLLTMYEYGIVTVTVGCKDRENYFLNIIREIL